jgi:classical protein kinase C/novel protein kinase C epsilon type
VKARTRASRNDRWTDETFNIDIDKANELELTVYDKSGDRPTPVAMLWMRISDIAEEMRRKKIEIDLASNGWVSADKMTQGAPGRPNNNPLPSPPGGQRQSAQTQQASSAPGTGAGNAVLIDSWFALEPVGRIHMQLSFGRRISYLLQDCIEMSTNET